MSLTGRPLGMMEFDVNLKGQVKVHAIIPQRSSRLTEGTTNSFWEHESLKKVSPSPHASETLATPQEPWVRVLGQCYGNDLERLPTILPEELTVTPLANGTPGMEKNCT